ncbi:manganese efflux pump [Rhodovarius crocodyli]|uniref:Putative manganese efflux pump MntP n=1 Tax=Rhodovarius crocodyli TaxID=1979269 RepID=A0A437M1Z2_9PROT|nr:manganese efflux pump MntP family protein [Rhodovarius crocodyli]RVT91622.1 manganese efflux pump [Rhodovarius crocodyli]
MTPATIAMLSFSMSADAFAASLAKGASLDRPRFTEALRTGLVFGVVEALTPLIGWAAGFAASTYIEAVDHWIAFGLLLAIGGRMVLQALAPAAHEEAARPRRHSLAVLITTAIATSLDAMAVGVSLAFLDVHIALVAGAIGLATFLMATAGILIARHVGQRLGRWAEGMGGLCLIGIGCAILIEHLGLLGA